MSRLRIFAAATGCAALAAAALHVVPAFATPGSGVSREGVANGQFGPLLTITHKDDRWPTWDLLFRTQSATDLGVDRLTFEPGAHTGWHSHAGPVYIEVKSGQLTWHSGADCSFRTLYPGDTFVEQANKVHLVENQGDEPAVLVAVAPRPRDAPGRLDADEPECAKAD